jgi:hypothetical protein
LIGTLSTPTEDELEFPPLEDGLPLTTLDDEDTPAAEPLLLSPSSLSDEQDRVNDMASPRDADNAVFVSCVLIMTSLLRV